MSLNTTPRTWTAGEVVTAAMMNTEVRDAITGIQAVWTAYTPTWTATTTNPTLGNGSFTGSGYLQVGKDIDFRIVLTMGSTTAFGTGTWLFSLPVTARAFTHLTFGTAGLWDTSGGAFRAGVIEQVTSTTCRILQVAAVAYVDNGGTSPWAWATSDSCMVEASYEAA